ncbi:MAG: 4-alpha-glucanotransferase [Candidatus Atribacteria bacterium]|nr:4-alpha-glucanotransferase [Candidatus Atribacteria bacterium]
MNNLRKLAELYGIETSYDDIHGNHVHIEDEILVNMLRSFGEYPQNSSDWEENLHRKEEEVAFPIPPVIVSSNRKITFIPQTNWLSGFLFFTREDILLEIPFRVEDQKWSFCLPTDLEWGYYPLKFEIRTTFNTLCLKSFFIFTPGFCYLPEGKNFWGLNLAVYSLNTGRNQEIGDLQDLRLVRDLLLKNGANFLGILPIHLLENRMPYGISPYYPMDRLEWNPIYLPLEWVAQILEINQELNSSEYCSLLNDQSPLNMSQLDYESAWKRKDKILRSFFQIWRKRKDHSPDLNKKSFFNFLTNGGKRIVHSAFFQAYALRQGRDFRSWPQDFQRKKEDAITQFIDTNQEEVYYFAFLQWLMELYLKTFFQSSDMLAFDLPVGTSPSGIESWLNQDLFVFSQQVGAPPDDFSPAGQNWGFSPVNPWKDRDNHYAHFISLIQTNMKFCSFLRIDHIMGLYRLFWIPEGCDPKYGTYVRSFFHDLLGIVALESHLQKVIVVGEDLGTVPPQVREAMKTYKMLSTRVLYFESDQNGFIPMPKHYPRETMVTIGTHDMPPLKAFLEGKDIDLRERLRLFTPEEATVQYQIRRQRIAGIRNKLIEWGYLSDPNRFEDFLEAVLLYLSKTSSTLKIVNLDDLMESDIQINLPGTITEYPNWRHRLLVHQDELEKKIRKMASIFK